MTEPSREPDPSKEASPNNGEDATQSRKKPKHQFPKSQVGKLWDEFGNPEEPVNLMPGAAYNSAGGKPKEPTFSDAVKSVSLKDISSFYKAPCARDSLIVGIGTGFGIGGVRAVLGGLRSLWSASNWAVGSFAVVSLAAHQYCQRKRSQEREGMKAAVEMMAEIKRKKQKEKEEKEAARKAAAEEERRRKSWTHLANYKFW